MDIAIEPATDEHSPLVASILLEAAEWLASTGRPMWQPIEIALDRVQLDVKAGRFFMARVNGEAAGVVKFQLTDPTFWPDISNDGSAFIHRLAVRRQFAGCGVSVVLIQFAASHAAGLKRQYLRLDCAADRPKLRALYERLGFTFHSIFQAGSWRVARYELALCANPSIQGTAFGGP